MAIEPDIARLVRKALRASSCSGAKLVDVSGMRSFLAETLVRSAGRRIRLLGRLRLLLSGFGTIRRLLLLPKLPFVSRPNGVSLLTTGCKILDFFLASAAAFETCSAFKRARVHGLIFTAVGFFFLIGSSVTVFLPNELTDPESGGTTSNWSSRNSRGGVHHAPRWKALTELALLNPVRELTGDIWGLCWPPIPCSCSLKAMM